MRSKFLIVFLTCFITMTGFAFGQNLNPIGDINTKVDYTINLTLSATPADSVKFSIWHTPAPPADATLNDNGDGTATFQWTPTGAQAGNHQIAFVVQDIRDGYGTMDQEIVNFYVDQAPVLNNIGSKTVTQGHNINFDISATDADFDLLAFSAGNLTASATLTDNGNGTATFDWTPEYGTKSSFVNDITFYVTDLVQLYTGELVNDSETVVFTVIEDINEPPILDPIGFKGAAAGDNLNFDITATDPNGTHPYFTVLGLNSLPGATLIDNGDGSATFDWNTAVEDEGVYSLTFFAKDVNFVDSEVVNITISEPANASPLIDSLMVENSVYLGDEVELSFSEGSLFEFTLYASDPDETNLHLSAENLPYSYGATFEDNGNGTGTFSWTPGYTRSGFYSIIVTATDGSLEVSHTIYLNVTDAGNQAPVFVNLGTQSVLEGNTLSFMITASDPEGEPVFFPQNVSEFFISDGVEFQDLGNDTALITWTPTYCQAADTFMSFVASDGFSSTTMLVNVLVFNDPANPPNPTLDSIGSHFVEEDHPLSFTVSSTIPFGCEIPAMGDNHNTRPEGAVWIDNGDGTGTFTWVPGFNQAGIYNLTFYADLGNSINYRDLPADSEVVTITVLEASNQPPVFTEFDQTNYLLQEEQELSFDLKAVDPEGNPVFLSIESLPAGATFTDNGGGEGTFNFIPGDSGTFEFNFKAFDGLVTATFTVDVTVFLGFGRVSLDHVDGLFGSSNNTIITCKPVTFYIRIDNNTGRDILNFKNSFEIVSYDDSLYYEDFDITGNLLYPDSLMSWARVTQDLVDTNNFDISINQITFDKFGMTGDYADTVVFEGIKSIENGYDSVIVAITIGPISPKFAGRTITLDQTFIKIGEEGGFNGIWDWLYDLTLPSITPDWGGPYVFTIADEPPATNNQPSITVPFTADTIKHCEEFSFNFDIADVDGLPNYGANGLPEGAILTDSLNGIINFTWQPIGKSEGVFDIEFFASDGCADSTITVTLTVENRTAPIIVAPTYDAISIATCEKLDIFLTGYEDSTFRRTRFTMKDGYPEGASISEPIMVNNTVDTLPDTSTFSWTPTIDQLGEHEITFYLTDLDDCILSGSVDSQVVTITVIENQAPDSNFAISDGTTRACDSLLIPLPWTDPEESPLSFEVTMEKELDGLFEGKVKYVGDTMLVWVPDYSEVGDYDLRIMVEDNCGNLDSQFFSITVTENLLPVVDLIVYDDGNIIDTIVAGDTISTNEESIIFDIFGSDPENDSISFTSEILFDTLQIYTDSIFFVDNEDNSAQYILYPRVKGFYRVDIIMTDQCGEVPVSFVVKFNYDVPPGVHAISDALPERFELVQNFPNPFNPYTMIEFQIPKSSHVSLEVFNVLGQKIKTLIDNKLARNRYNVEWDGTSDNGGRVASGIYFYRILTEYNVATKKMLMLK